MNSINTIKAGLTAIADPEGREFTAQTLLDAVTRPEHSGQNEWTQYERSRNRVQTGEVHPVVLEFAAGVNLMQGPVPYRPNPVQSKEGRDQSEDYRVGAQYQVVGHSHGRDTVYAVHNWFGQRVTAYSTTYDRAHKWKEHWQGLYEQHGRYLKGATTSEEVVE